MKTRPEQYGDVVLDVPTGSGQSEIVRRQSRTPACRALGFFQALLGVAALWFLKVQDTGQIGMWLMMPAVALGLLTGKWGVKEELWRKPSDATARAAYQIREIIQNALWVAIYAAFMAYVFWGPVGAGPWLTALITLIAAIHLLGDWIKRTQDRWLERVPAY
ncbi:hypothetical protein [Phenylobacterium sp.]|uniref:hypothetical protein n=1 Tax=Phenylobacterium sp. TaxID=1871053 RepID=UPI003D2B9DC7